MEFLQERIAPLLLEYTSVPASVFKNAMTEFISCALRQLGVAQRNPIWLQFRSKLGLLIAALVRLP
ncbi:MAG: hypothetical protein IPQ18_08880 [Saprospiraceae bacterium]|nr:hypothetical protein [Saprospiraceae bacterium]